MISLSETRLDPLFSKIIQVRIAIFVDLFLFAAVDLHVVFQPLFVCKLNITDFAFEGFFPDIDDCTFSNIKSRELGGP